VRDCEVNHTPIVEIGQLLRDHGLTPEIIGRLASCATHDVVQALNPQQFQECPLILVARVRAVVELALAAQAGAVMSPSCGKSSTRGWPSSNPAMPAEDPGPSAPTAQTAGVLPGPRD
jgi:hypothetical protein